MILALLTLVVRPGTVLAAEELMVSAAASLTDAIKTIARQFEEDHPGVKVVLNFAASGVLLQQMAQGAPVDVFISADQKTMDQAQEKGLIVPETRKNLVSNGLVLIVPQDSRLALKDLPSLARPEVKRLGLGNPETVPAGRYTREALRHQGLWEALQPKYIMGESVRQVLDYVSRGEVDAGFVFATDAAIAKGKVTSVQVVKGHQPILYPMALVAASRHPDLARKFLDFLGGSKAREIFTQYGFGEP
jgi:molybdate transport system substrate-binding protein